jgi:uncharacterized cupredoxin-like copper-binding protein
MNKRRLAALLAVPFLALAMLAVACGGDDDDATGGPTGASPTEAGQMDHMAASGVVSAKPADAIQVDVVLREWAVAPAQTSVAAGKVYFLVENSGPDHPHEFVVIRSDLGPLDLPFEDNKVPEADVDFVDEIEEFAPHSSASLTVDLTAGKYLLICNITEDDEAIGSHYKKGMVATFTVE